jgi:hypothetical protein
MIKIMQIRHKSFWILFISFFCSGSLMSQTILKDELIFLTSEWKGERFTDGRPKIADDLLIRSQSYWHRR